MTMGSPGSPSGRARWPHYGRIATAVALALTGLAVYLFVSSHATPLESSSGSSVSSAGPVPPAKLSCSNPAVIPMASGYPQSGLTEGDYYITNDTWNAAHYSLSQSLHICNYNSWYALATMNNDNGDGAVKTSPNVQETWYPTPTKLSSWAAITSHFSDVPPGVGPETGIWEFEYDVWLNGLADSASTEVMIWTYNNGQTPSGTPSGIFTSAGHTYDVYHSAPPYQYIAFADRSNNLSGQVNLLAFFRYVISRGWMASSSTLYQICNGVELVSTNNKPEKFTIDNFAIDMKARA
jgi:hypothetical protein